MKLRRSNAYECEKVERIVEAGQVGGLSSLQQPGWLVREDLEASPDGDRCLWSALIEERHLAFKSFSAATLRKLMVDSHLELD